MRRLRDWLTIFDWDLSVVASVIEAWAEDLFCWFAAWRGRAVSVRRTRHAAR